VPELDIKNASVYQGFKGGQNRPGTGDFSVEIPIDQSARRSLVRRRNVGLAFVRAIGVFVVAAILCADVVKSGAAQIVPMAESYPAAIPKSVVIGDFPEDKEPSLVWFGVVPIRMKSFLISGLRPLFCSSLWRKDNVPLQSANTEKLLGFRPVSAEFLVNEPAYMAGWQVSGIMDENIAGDAVIAPGIGLNAPWLYADISALNDSRIPPRQIDSDQRNKSQDASYKNEPYSKTSDFVSVSRKLASIFSNQPVVFYFFYLLFACGIWWCGFLLWSNRHRFVGGLLIVIGYLVFIGTGFATISVDPFR